MALSWAAENLLIVARQLRSGPAILLRGALGFADLHHQSCLFAREFSPAGLSTASPNLGKVFPNLPPQGDPFRAHDSYRKRLTMRSGSPNPFSVGVAQRQREAWSRLELLRIADFGLRRGSAGARAVPQRTPDIGLVQRFRRFAQILLASSDPTPRGGASGRYQGSEPVDHRGDSEGEHPKPK